MQKITPFLWFEKDAQKAAEFYVDVFGEGSKITNVTSVSGTPSGTIEVVSFELRGQSFTIMGDGETFDKINAAISFVIDCRDQEEIDYFWEKLSRDSDDQGQCGWIKDKYGVSWQVVPAFVVKMISDPDPVKSQRAMQAMLQMNKLDINALKQAYNGDADK